MGSKLGSNLSLSRRYYLPGALVRVVRSTMQGGAEPTPRAKRRAKTGVRRPGDGLQMGSKRTPGLGCKGCKS
jgi:hypothetical protein